MFFKVAKNDVNQCLQQIKLIQVPELMSTAQYEEQIKVTVSLRAKLISEIKVNVCKLKVSVFSSDADPKIKFGSSKSKRLCGSPKTNAIDPSFSAHLQRLHRGVGRNMQNP